MPPAACRRLRGVCSDARYVNEGYFKTVLFKAQSLSAPSTCNTSLRSVIDNSTIGRSQGGWTNFNCSCSLGPRVSLPGAFLVVATYFRDRLPERS